MLAGEPQAADIGPEVLMHFEARTGGPVAVATEGPGGGAPAGIHEGRGLRDVLGAIHVAEDGKDLGFGGGIVLVFGGIGLIGDDGDEEDPGAGEEAWTVKGLEDGVVAAFDGVRVEEELSGGVPEHLVRGELKEYLCVGGCNMSMNMSIERLDYSPIENVSMPSCFHIGSSGENWTMSF